MDENKNTQTGAAPDHIGCFCSSLTPRQMLSAQLRDLSHHVSDTDRCTLCKAAEELGKPENTGMSWAFPFLFLMLSGGFGNGLDIDPDGMKAYMDTVDRKREENKDKGA